MRVVRVRGTLERGGAQLSTLRLTVALRRHGIATTWLAGNAIPSGIELAARYGVPADAYHVSDAVPVCSLQWTPRPDFADWLAPRLRQADVVHAHMFGAWWAAAQTVPAHVPLVASEHNQMTWPGDDHTPQARGAGPRVDMFFAHGPAARAWAVEIGMDDGRLREGRSSVEGLNARPPPCPPPGVAAGGSPPRRRPRPPGRGRGRGSGRGGAPPPAGAGRTRGGPPPAPPPGGPRAPPGGGGPPPAVPRAQHPCRRASP